MGPSRLATTLLAAAALSCSLPSASIVNDVPGLSNGALAQTYTGVLQEGGGASKYYVNLAQTVTVTQSSPVQLTFSSSAFPSFEAVVLSTGQSAVNLQLVGFSKATGVQLQEVAFAKVSVSTMFEGLASTRVEGTEVQSRSERHVVAGDRL